MATNTELISGVDFIAVPVKDYEAAAKFYGEVLGLTVTGVSYAEVAPRGARSSRASGCAGCQPAR